ncbi:TusE/DsrC/DsvC family sulfur relay protein [Porticoccaceae bacterium]|jgi:tRNA 2-thiouridine synthesizing protein E|nr:TusE/DsrC/DsvC family sulfur relay protein [Porticoccaceae bacterium]MDC1476837.1 TusE/DsrC/DsvC family sulfur relay protein [Porticoccaceae bacterium]CAI8259183.1 MAG: Sulfurtransferase TusE [SAR92 bacterium MED-G29]|tara:strand:+ start:1292 stop:1591 length:300 start_codon:yes stop_codon:yes gene_type:complete
MTEEKYLDKLPEWSIAHAQTVAVGENITLNPEHVEILEVARAFYADYGFSPSMRPLCKSVAGALGVEKGRSLYLNQHFPGSPARLVALLAGLPKPKNCL